MELDFDRIVRIKRIRAKKSELSEEENLLSLPSVTDRRHISRIKDMFTEIISEWGTQVYGTTVSNRKKLIFIILYLYSPSTLAGGKMPKNLREDINKALGIHSKSVVSNNFSDVIFLYEHYADFKNDVQQIYVKIVEKLENEGLTNQRGE